MNMNPFGLFSKKNKNLPDIYFYDKIPQKVRIQIVHIIKESIENENLKGDFGNAIKKINHIRSIMLSEFGQFSLYNSNYNPFDDFLHFFLHEVDIEKIFDGLQLFFQAISSFEYQFGKPKLDASDAVARLNRYFLESGFGYRMENGNIFRIDSEYIHRETVIDTLMLIQAKEYSNINSEFISAHEHFRHGRYSESMVDSLKAFESALKIACKKRIISFNPNDTSKKLLDNLFNANFFPPYIASYTSNLRVILESGIPTIRNRTSGHGKGDSKNPELEATEQLANFVLNMTGATIKYIINNLTKQNY